MPAEEIAWRLGAAARSWRDRLTTSVATPRWDRRRLARVLAHDVLDPILITHLEREDWQAAQRTLVRTMQAAPRPFVLEPRLAMELRHQVLRRWPDAAATASARADRLMGGHYDLLGYAGLSFDDGRGGIDWHHDPVNDKTAPRWFWADVPYLDAAVAGDHKVIWELNRHQHWLVLGRALWLTRDRRYAWAIVSQLESWLAANPPLIGINWASALELGFRTMSWVWVLHFLLADTNEGASGPTRAPWLIDLLIALDRQLTHLEQNLSYYFSPNTHLTGEALALYVAGLSLPELASSARRADIGRRILLAEIDRQVGADGGHAERSTHYHRYTLDFYLLALLMAERAKDTEAIARFTDTVARAAGFARAMADDHGRFPLIGDDDGGMLWPLADRACNDVRDSLALAAVVLARPDLAPWGVPEEVFWIAGRTAFEQEPFLNAYRAEAAPLRSSVLHETGYAVSRGPDGGHLVFDVGAHGYMNGGHAHADALAVTLAVGGRPLLVDPGTGSYTTDPVLRDRFRRSANHNTLTLDGRSSSEPSGPFHWQRRTDAHAASARVNPRFDWLEGYHDGYESNRHRRTVLRSPGGAWMVADEILGRGRHEASVHWHFDPAWVVTREAPGRLRATHMDGTTVWLLYEGAAAELTRGDEASGLGWISPVYGMVIPTWSARVSRTESAPFTVLTWISGNQPRALSRIDADGDPGGTAPLALSVRERNVTWTTMVRAGEAAVRETRGCGIGAYHTDGRLLHYGALDEGRLLTLSVCDANHVLALREGWVSIAADAPVPDLSLDVVGDRIDVWSSAAAPRLHLQGELVAAARLIRLNGRELPAAARDRRDSVAAPASAWGDPVNVARNPLGTSPCVE